MKLFLDINEITEAQAKSGEPTFWECVLDEADNFAWQAPMLGDGGSSESETTLSTHIARYAGLDDLDPSDGPDECVFVENGKFYHVTITVG